MFVLTYLWTAVDNLYCSGGNYLLRTDEGKNSYHIKLSNLKTNELSFLFFNVIPASPEIVKHFHEITQHENQTLILSFQTRKTTKLSLNMKPTPWNY